MDPAVDEITPFSENEMISLSTTPESGFGNKTSGAGLNISSEILSFKDEFQQLQVNQVPILQTSQRKKSERYQRQKKPSSFLRKKIKKDYEEKMEKILKENEELRNHLKYFKQRLQKLEWDAQDTNQGFKKDIKDLQGKAQASEWGLEDINRNLRNVTNEVERHSAQIDGIEARLANTEDA